MPGFLSNMKMPSAVEGLIAELRERRLLPVAIVLVVAIVAVPVLLSSSSPAPQPPRAAAAGIAATFQTTQGEPVVVTAGQGVRNYKKRLDTAAAKNPFLQQHVAATSGGSSPLVATGAAASSAAAATPTVATAGKATAKSGARQGTKYVAYTIKAYVGEAGTKLTLRANVQRLFLLPSTSVPVVDFLGVSGNAKLALFMVSPQVSQLSGDGICVMRGTTCSLLTLAPGKTATFAFSDGKTYAVSLVKINRVLTSKPVG
jgi:hypothetical protein